MEMTGDLALGILRDMRADRGATRGTLNDRGVGRERIDRRRIDRRRVAIRGMVALAGGSAAQPNLACETRGGRSGRQRAETAALGARVAAPEGAP